jgi:hypothetical protein
MASAGTNPSIIARIGQPIQAGIFISGSIEVTVPAGKADLAIPISGPKGRGTLYVAAVKKAGIWSLTDPEFGVDGDSRRLDLLAH